MSLAWSAVRAEAGMREYLDDLNARYGYDESEGRLPLAQASVGVVQRAAVSGAHVPSHALVMPHDT